MYIEIRLIGEVALKPSLNESIGYKYDIPFDELDIPYIPLGNILRENGLLPEDVLIGSAYPEGYMGIIKAVTASLPDLSDTRKQIRSYFTNSRSNISGGYIVRSLKSGQRFRSTVDFPKEMKKNIVSLISDIKKIGVYDEGITGEVELSLVEEDDTPKKSYDLNRLCCYSSVKYSLMLLTPMCIEAPYADGEKALNYIPGNVIRNNLKSKISFKETGRLIFTNAYIGDGVHRFVPSPLCSSVIKLDKTQFRYRLAPGKDPSIVEQGISIADTYTSDFQTNLVKYSSPVFKRIVTSDSAVHDAMLPGQLFSGIIYGTDADIRKITGYCAENPVAFLGDYTSEGYGEVYLQIDEVCEDDIPAPFYSDTFDLVCVSDTYIIDDNGMPACKAEDLLREAEYLLSMENKLQLTGRYTDIYKDYSIDSIWKTHREVIRCIAKGSVLRISTADGRPVDISPLLHCFIGERISEGYGEIMAFPARGRYYRLAEKVPPVRYTMEIPMSFSTKLVESDFVDEIITGLLKQRVKALAMIDIPEYKRGVGKEQLIPYDILIMLKNRYNPLLSDDEIINWYSEGLEAEYV